MAVVLRTCRRLLPPLQQQAFSSLIEGWPDASEPIERARTPPASWYTDRPVLRAEEARVFRRHWQAVGHVQQVEGAGDYFTGSLLGQGYVVCRDDEGQLRAFYNVCRHHASPVAAGAGRTPRFTCPYHGWTYRLDGRLLAAPRVGGIERFRAADHGLVPLEVDTWGPFVFVRAPGGSRAGSVADWLGAGGQQALQCGLGDAGLVAVAERTYPLACNWKVFVDNYLDGGYHVPVAHAALAHGLRLDSYRSSTFPSGLSIQTCEPRGGDARLAGVPAAYVYAYPNFMVNRYGPWMDTNTVLPTSETTCAVVFRYYLEGALAQDAAYVAAGLRESECVQREDTELCEGVQRGIASPAYGAGRYAPGLEGPMFSFHQRLNEDLHEDLLDG